MNKMAALIYKPCYDKTSQNRLDSTKKTKQATALKLVNKRLLFSYKEWWHKTETKICDFRSLKLY